MHPRIQGRCLKQGKHKTEIKTLMSCSHVLLNNNFFKSDLPLRVLLKRSEKIIFEDRRCDSRIKDFK